MEPAQRYHAQMTKIVCYVMKGKIFVSFVLKDSSRMKYSEVAVFL